MLKILRDLAMYLAFSFTLILAVATSMNILDLKVNFGYLPGLDEPLKVHFWFEWKDIFIMTMMLTSASCILSLGQYIKDRKIK